MATQIGGKVLTSGGFGCIFEPALRCQYETPNLLRNRKQVSKLMTTKHAKDEYKQIQTFNATLRVIPNYSNYFLLKNFKLCKPSKLTDDDLRGYQKKCKALKKKGIYSKNINNSLDKVLTINMPNGGIDVEQFINQYVSKRFTPVSNIIRLNNSLIDLLINGIIPMNKLNVYHCDIKDSNVLVNIVETRLETRLIDWGLSFIYNDKFNGIPRKIYGRPFQYNVPFSSVIFNKDFLHLYNKFLKSNSNPDYFQIREFIVNYIFIWNEIRGTGHLSAINSIIKNLTIQDLTAIKKNNVKEHFIEYDFTYYYIVEYLSKILEKYTNNGSFDIMSYFKNVFLKNIDIWGFVMIYIVLYEYLYESYDKLNEYQMEFITKIKYIIIHFLYECPINPIDVSLLTDELTSLNKVIEKFDIQHSSKKLKYISELDESIGGFKINKTAKLKRNRKTHTRKRR